MRIIRTIIEIKIMSCFSVWGEGGEGFGNFPIPKAYKEGENVYHYELT